MSAKMTTKIAEDTIFLYVLLERISNVREYSSSEGGQTEEDWLSLSKIENAYENYFKYRKSGKGGKGGATSEQALRNYWERELTKDEILKFGKITVDIRNRDYAFGGDTAKIPQQTPYKLNGETLLHFAIRIPFKEDDPIAEPLTRIIKHLIKTCPRLLKLKYRGLTPLQVAVVKGNADIVEAMVETFDSCREKCPKEWDYPNKTLPAYKGTKMMAATPLALAAVCDHRDIFCHMSTSEAGAKTIDDTNEGGDNIYHSLIRHAHRKNSEDNVLGWFDYISNREWENLPSKRKKTETTSQNESRDNSNDEQKKKKTTIPQVVLSRQLWMMTNNEKLNPLQLAAKLGQYKLFSYIMKTPVYLGIESSDGLVDEEMYDITEIETLPIDDHEDIFDETTDKQDQPEGIKQKSVDTVDIQRDYHTSILEYVSKHDARTAFQFIRFSPMKGVLFGKWKKYQWVCALWFIFHMVFMGFITYTAVVKRSILYDSPYQNGSTSTPEKARFVYSFSDDVTIRLSTIFSLVVGVVYLSIECFRLLSRRFRARMTRNALNNVVKQFKNPYSNMTFRVCFFVFSLMLILDSWLVFFKPQYYENYLTPFSIIIGWYLVLFFLQVWHPFSFFTVLIQKVIIDLIKFAFVMSFLLIAFTAAMFMVMQGAQHIDEDFIYFRRTTMKMLMIMIGLGDLDVLFTARSSLMAVIVFVLFVLLTTILLLNALIALMSNTCTELMSAEGNVPANRLHSYLQKLSMILYLESFFISKFIVVVGEIKATPNRYQNRKWLTLNRRKWMKKTLNTNDKSFGLMDDSENKSKFRKRRSRRKRHHTTSILPELNANIPVYSITKFATYNSPN